MKIRNLSDYPAISMDVSAKLILDNDNSEDKHKVFSSTAQKINVLSGLEESNKNCSFMYMEKNGETKYFESLIRPDKSKSPKFVVEIYYRNTYGACFILRNGYMIGVKDENDHILKDWYKSIKNFNIDYYKDIQSLDKLREKDLNQWHESFTELKENLNNALIGDDELKVELIEVPNSLFVKSISVKEYSEKTNDFRYGVPSVLLKGRRCSDRKS